MKRRDFICALGAAAVSPILARAQQPGTSNFRVHPSQTFQTMTGFGAGFDGTTERLIDTIGNPAGRARAYDLLYGDSGAGLNIVRLTISPNAQPAPGAGAPHFRWEADEHTQSVWRALQPVFQRTKPILYAVPFTPPARWKTNGRLKGGGALKREHYPDYATYLADFLEYYRKALGAEIDVLSLQNEPGVAAPWEACVWTGAQLRDFLKILAPTVRSRGLTTLFMLSEGTAWSGAWQRLFPALADPETHRLLGVMASHSYGAPDDQARKEFAAASGRNGLPVWMSEMSLMIPPQRDDPGMGDAIRIARYLHRDLTEAHASVWIYCFAIFTAKFQGSMGVLSPPDNAGPLHGKLVIPKRLWAIAHYSRFARPGWKLMHIEGAGIDSTGFVGPQGGKFVIAAVNPGRRPAPARYEFVDRTIGAVQAFATTQALDLAPVQPPAADAHGFSAMLPPVSVMTFEGTLGR